MVMYDVSMKTKRERKEYNLFHKKLHCHGFIMLQESIYYKYLKNIDNGEIIANKIRLLRPKQSVINCLVLTANQFEEMNKISINKIDLSRIKSNIIVI